tara:strand:+ start:265 stop:474 length:210 start_codon:yes stop_codon:yes gene_type:complete
MSEETITIDCTPTWRGILPALLLIYTEAETVKARAEAFDELVKMASLADRFVDGIFEPNQFRHQPSAQN